MTLLIFDQWENGVDIYTDTLVVTPDHEPIGHSTKVWTVPHLRVAIAVTGTADIGQHWAQRVAWTPEATDIVELDAQATRNLNEIHAGLASVAGDIGTATVYMFGFPQGSDKLFRYIYRSVRGYQSEPSEPGPAFAIKPEGATPVEIAPNTAEGIIEIAARIRDDHAQGRVAERLPIGGQLMRTRVLPRGLIVECVHQFPDDDTDWRKRDR